MAITLEPQYFLLHALLTSSLYHVHVCMSLFRKTQLTHNTCTCMCLNAFTKVTQFKVQLRSINVFVYFGSVIFKYNICRVMP